MSHIVIDDRVCKSCKLCISVCPKNLIKTLGNTLTSQQQKFLDINKKALQEGYSTV